MSLLPPQNSSHFRHGIPSVLQIYSLIYSRINVSRLTFFFFSNSIKVVIRAQICIVKIKAWSIRTNYTSLIIAPWRESVQCIRGCFALL